MENLSVRIEPMTPSLAEAMATLERVCFSLPWSHKSCLDELENPIACYYAAVSGKPGEEQALHGYAGMQDIAGEGYITNIAVAPGMRRTGLGRQLLTVLIDEAMKRKLSLVTLEVRVSNHPAIALYSKLGFTITGLRKGYYEKPKEDAHLMSLLWGDSK